jgi:hypothetical protein
MYSELEEGQTMVNPLHLTSMLVDWMDPEKTVYAPSSYASLMIRSFLFLFSSEKCLAARRTITFTWT